MVRLARLAGLKTALDKAGIEQGDLARKLDVSPVTVSRWKSGKRNPDLNTLKAIANELACTVDELLHDPGALSGPTTTKGDDE